MRSGLGNSYVSVGDFLRTVLRKINEFIPTDLGFVGIVEESDGDKWIVLRDPANDIIGAECGEWQRYTVYGSAGRNSRKRNDHSSASLRRQRNRSCRRMSAM